MNGTGFMGLGVGRWREMWASVRVVGWQAGHMNGPARYTALNAWWIWDVCVG